MESSIIRKLTYVAVLLTIVGMGAIPASAETSDIPSALDFQGKIEQMKAHTLISLELLRDGEFAQAQLHAGHPVAEYWDIVGLQFTKSNPQLADKTKDALDDLSKGLDGKSVEEQRMKMQEAWGLLDEATSEVIPNELAAGFLFRARVTISLLEWTGHEYDEATAGPEIELHEAQDALGGVLRAEQLYDEVRHLVGEEKDEEIKEFFAELKVALGEQKDLDEVEKWIKGIVHELEEIAGLNEETSVGQLEITTEIKEMLNEVVELHKDGKYEEALKVASSAYLEKYELVEGEVIKKAPAINDRIEEPIRVELREMINAKENAEKVSSHVANINKALDEAAAILIDSTLATGNTGEIPDANDDSLSLVWPASVTGLVALVVVEAAIIAKLRKH